MALIYCLGTNNKQNNLAKKRYQCGLEVKNHIQGVQGQIDIL